MPIINPAKTYNLSDFIDMKDNDNFTYSTLAVFMYSIDDKTVIYSSDNVIYHYREELKAASVPYTFTDKEYRKYAYRPKLLAYDIYGSTELYFILLAINDTCNIKDFNKRTINILYKQDLSRLLNQISLAEENRLKINRTAINDVLKEREEESN